MPQLIARPESQGVADPLVSGTETIPDWIGTPPANILGYFWELLTPQGWMPISVGLTGSGGCFLPWVNSVVRVCAHSLEWTADRSTQVVVTYRSDVYGPITPTPPAS